MNKRDWGYREELTLNQDIVEKIIANAWRVSIYSIVYITILSCKCVQKYCHKTNFYQEEHTYVLLHNETENVIYYLLSKIWKKIQLVYTKL